MTEPTTPGCPHCQRLQTEVERLTTRLAALEAELAKARKHSGNSSKPPSSDITTPPRSQRSTATTGRRKRGGQPGHPRHQRLPFNQQQLTATVPYRLDACPCCGGPVQDADVPAKVQQQVEIQEVPVTITEHQRIAQWCHQCHKLLYATLPEALVQAGLVGPRLTALVGFLKGACHLSFSAIRKFFRDVLGVPVSRGLLTKLIHKVSASLHDPYEELLHVLPHEARLNVDETGHKDNGQRLWTWCFRASLYTLFKISPSRGSDVLVEVLGEEFDGLLGCDYFSAYRKYMKDFDVAVQFCLAHFIRDVKFLAEHPEPQNRAYGQRLLEHLRKLFAIIHRREEYTTEEGFRRALVRVRRDLVWDATVESPHTQQAVNIEERFYQHLDSYFRFITTPGVEPTNNLAEQAIRFVAVHRRLTQGTRGEAGQSWCERIWTVVLTCGQQGRSVFAYLCEAVAAHFAGQSAPSLLPNTS
jgi:transposase